MNAFASAHIDLVVFFDGTLRENRKHTAEYNEYRQKTNSVLKHIRMIGTPPPKIWWLAPSGLKTCLRNALRSLNIPVVQTVYDHTMEIIDYFYESKLDGLLGLNADYIIANVSKYYSSHDLRLSYKGALETKEYVVSKLLTSLNLSTEQMPFVAVLLGGYTLIDETTLKAIHQKIEATSADFEARLRRIAEVVRSTPTSSADEFIQHLELSDWTKEIKDTLEYFQRKARFINTKKFLGGKRKNVIEIQRICDNTPSVPMASETNETDEIARKILDDVSNLVDDGDVSATPSGDAAATSQTTVASVTPSTSTATNESGKGSAKNVKANAFVYALPGEVLKTALNRHQRGIMDSRIYQLLTKKEIFLPQVRLARNQFHCTNNYDFFFIFRFSKTNNIAIFHRFMCFIVRRVNTFTPFSSISSIRNIYTRKRLARMHQKMVKIVPKSFQKFKFLNGFGRRKMSIRKPRWSMRFSCRGRCRPFSVCGLAWPSKISSVV